MPLTEEQLQTLRRQLLKKGSEVNEKLVQLLNNQNPTIMDIIEGRPGETKIERLRRWLNLIDKKIKAIPKGEYGKCEQCGAELTFTGLQQVPWAEVCPTCASAGQA